VANWCRAGDHRRDARLARSEKSIKDERAIADHERPTISSDSDNDLAELPILLEIAMGFDHFVEREGSIDDRPKCARFESLVMYSTAALRRISSPLVKPDVVSLDDQHLSDQIEDGQSGRGVGERTIEIEDALEGKRRYQLAEGLAAHGIEGDACTFALGDPRNLCYEVSL
jgi:hypothetical protein